MRILLFIASVLEWLCGIPDLDADQCPRLRVKHTVYPPDRPESNREYWDWVRENYLRRTA
jgi:hypothetical protein